LEKKTGVEYTFFHAHLALVRHFPLLSGSLSSQDVAKKFFKDMRCSGV
jgi:hypothetical protein